MRSSQPQPVFDWFDGRARLLLQAAPDAMVIVDGSGKIVLANSQIQLLFGYAEQELVGEPIEMLIPEAYRGGHGAHRAAYAKQPRVREMGTGLELYALRKGGTQFPVEISLSPLNIGGVRFVTAAIRDISNRRNTEAKLRKLNTELHAKIAELAAVKLASSSEPGDPKSPEARLRQMQKMEAVGQLASGVAHDFNNILGAISGYAELLEQRLPESSEETQMVAEMRAAIKRAAGLTSQLLAFGRKEVVMPVVLDPNTVCREIEKMLKRIIGEDIELETDLRDVKRIRIDRGQLEQVLLNFAVNARDAMPTGGRLKIATRMVDLDEAYVRTHPEFALGKYIEISVSDTGLGMDETTRQHLFEPFFTTKEVGKGTGLGLATVFGIIKQNSGHVNAYSELGQGSVFRVYLRPTDQPIEQQTHVASTEAITGSETILLVEDENQLRTVMKMYLESLGYSVIAASNGNEAMRLLGTNGSNVALLVTDVVMPGSSGGTLAQQVLQKKPGLPVLFMSGYTDDAMLRHGFEEGTFPFLRKPFSLHELVAKIREILDTSQPRAADTA
jgi:PAS domain S-box-containing protein